MPPNTIHGPNGSHMGWYYNGVYHGDWITWSVDGQKTLEAAYNNGNLHGDYREWFADGTPSLEVTYLHGTSTGIQTTYYDTGEIAEQGEMIDGMRRGVWTVGEPDGVTRSCLYLRGDLIGCEGDTTLPEDLTW